MSVSHRYRNFGGSRNSSGPAGEDKAEALEEQKLQAFEAGYQAGWDDAEKSQADAKGRVSAELSQNLLDMSFTYHEALSKLTMSLEPVMGTIVKKLLPEIVKTSLSAHILEQFDGLVKEQADKPVEVVVSPANTQTVLEMVGEKLPTSFTVVGDASLGAGQAFVRIADTERQIDLNAIIDEINKALAGFFHDAAEETTDE